MSINVGIAGFGLSGKTFHAPFLHASPNFQIKKVFERNSEKSKEEYPYVQVVHRFCELLTEDIDLVVISTPNAYHFAMAKEAILAGKHVIVEKPVTIYVKDAQELLNLSREKHVIFTAYQNRRFDGDFLTIKQIVEEGVLGEILDVEVHYDRFVEGVSSKEWKAAGGPGVNILYDLGVHIADQAYTLFGMPNEVYADFRKQRAATPEFDSFELILYYDATKVSLQASEIVVNHGPRYRINGRNGSFVKYGIDAQEEALLSGKKPPQKDWGKEAEQFNGDLFVMKEGSIVTKKIPTINGDYGLFYENIYDVCMNRTELLVKPEEAIDVLKIIEAAIKSDQEKRRVQLDSFK
ncbi:MAG: oxidoreductase [Clostridia bacterium]|nr:oxidoreductase [Clostridia bacterium]